MRKTRRPSDAEHPSSDVLAAFAVGNLGDAQLAIVGHHVSACDRCAAVVADSPRDDFVERLLEAARSDWAKPPRTSEPPAVPAPRGAAIVVGARPGPVDKNVPRWRTTAGARAVLTPAVLLPLATALVCLGLLLAR